jgi:hypothetical protein
MPSNPYEGRRSSISGVRHGGGTLKSGQGGAELARQSTRTDINAAKAAQAGAAATRPKPGEIGLLEYDFGLFAAFQAETYEPFIQNGLGFQPGWENGVLETLGFGNEEQTPDTAGKIGPDATPDALKPAA